MVVLKRKSLDDNQHDGPDGDLLPADQEGIRAAHDELVKRAEKWLRYQSCKVVIRDPFRCWTQEQPDAIGWRSDVSILVECKVSRSDFLSDKNKAFRVSPEKGMGDWRFYLCPPDIIRPEDLPDGWGLLWAYPNQIKKIHGVPTNCGWYSMPHRGNKVAETTMLVSALRRLALRGHLPEIYDGPIGAPNKSTRQVDARTNPPVY